MNYKTSLDNLAKGITIFVTILFAAIIVLQFFAMKETGLAIPVFTSVALCSIYFGVFAFRPKNYSLVSGELVIHRLFTDIKIDRDKIKNIEILDAEKLKGTIRTFGVGGLFGYFGQFYNSSTGKMTWYATRRNKTVLVETSDNKKIILTPDEPDKFVADFYTNK